MLLIAQIMMILRNEDKYAISMGYISLIIRLFRIQYKTPIAEACDYFWNSTLEEIARLHRSTNFY